jgi:putative nucleotidyltransferase with HDIG domain
MSHRTSDQEMNTLREGVRRSLPELNKISDTDLRDKVVEAWALALSQTEFRTIEDVPGEGNPGDWVMQKGTQADHIRVVARMAVALADQIEAVFGPIGVNRDILLAAGLVHDVGKPFEMSPRNQERWRKNPAAAGYPSLRHPAYGAHIALTVGLPEAVVHCAGCHSLPSEGQFVMAGLENMLVQYADNSVWRILLRAGLVKRPGGKDVRS